MVSLRALLVMLVLGLGLAAAAPGAAVAAEDDSKNPNLFVSVERMRLVLVNEEHKVTGALQYDLSIEARDVAGRDRITLLMPRIRDALLTRLGTQEVTGRHVSADQLNDAKRRILQILRQTVGEGAVASVHVVSSYVYPV
jgi:flagellar basal body-associated protein FliL